MNKQELISTLKSLYGKQSKHSHYQSVPEFVVQAVGYSEPVREDWRGDQARYRYLLRQLEAKSIESLIDIGANTGFFSLSLANRFKDVSVAAYEPNAEHSQFSETVARTFGLDNFRCHRKGIGEKDLDELPPTDLTIILNVLHHLGNEFDQSTSFASPYSALERIASYLTTLSRTSKFLFFQIGYNWGGNKQTPLLSQTDPAYSLALLLSLCNQGWETLDVSFASKVNGQVEYVPLPSSLVQSLGEGRVDRSSMEFFLTEIGNANFPGEFYKRPLLFLRAKDQIR